MLFQYVGIISAHESTAIADHGVDRHAMRPATPSARALRPGTAPSRENANIIRDAAVTDAAPQKNCATHAMRSSDLGPVRAHRTSARCT